MNYNLPDRLYCMYLRKSRADRDSQLYDEQEILARHEMILKETAEKMGIRIGKIYTEIVSGETIADRPEIKNVINDCYAGLYQGILVVEVTRLSRGNQGDAQTIMDCLRYGNRNQGVLVVTPTKIYDIVHSSEDEEYMEFELFMSRREYKMIKKRLERGRIHAVIEGQYMGSYRPYGYDIVKDRKVRTLTPNPSEAPVVKQIFEWTVKDNMTPGQVARKLDDLGIPTYTKSQEWSIDTIKTILKNPTYTGKVRWNDRMQVKTMVDGELKASRPRSNHTDKYILVDGLHDAIVSDDIFQAASKRFYSDKTKNNTELKSPFAGLLVCGKCGKAMVFQSYRCRKENARPRYLHPYSHKCNVSSVLYDDILDAIESLLYAHIRDFQILMDKLPATRAEMILEQSDSLQKEIERTQQKLTKLFDAWENGIISDSDFSERKAIHQKKLEDLQSQLASIEKQQPKEVVYQEKMIQLKTAVEALKAPDISAKTKNFYLKQVIAKIEFSRESKAEFILDVDFK